MEAHLTDSDYFHIPPLCGCYNIFNAPDISIWQDVNNDG